MLTIRQAKISDLPGITEIYNDAVLKLTATFDTEPKNLKEQKVWFGHHNDTYPIVVAEEEGLVVGWASISRWSDKLAYAGTGESRSMSGRGTGGGESDGKCLPPFWTEAKRADCTPLSPASCRIMT